MPWAKREGQEDKVTISITQFAQATSQLTGYTAKTIFGYLRHKGFNCADGTTRMQTDYKGLHGFH